MISLLLAGFGSTRAAEVSQEQAVEMAKTRVTGTVGSIKTVSYEGQKAYYVVQYKEGGWVLVSADDRSMPIIGYNDKGTFQTEGQPENLRSVMSIMAGHVIANKKAGGARLEAWDKPENVLAARAQASAADVVAPLITVNWNQTGKFQTYCPGSGSNQAVVGCVAVGMAQAMSVAQWPPRPVGEFQYTSANYGPQYINYDKEPDYNWDALLTGANNYDDVARFLWHCGVSVSMDYGADGSGAQSAAIATALKRNFQYPANSVKYYSRDSYGGTDEEWKELILNELKEGRAVAYSGQDPKGNYGHCFNLDGYNGEFFSVNWGWGGQNNGYFPLNGLKDAKMNMNYTDGQGVVVGIRQPSEKPQNIDLSSRKVQAGMPAGTFVADVIVESEAQNPTYKYELLGKYSARQHDYLEAPFKIEDNKLYTTKELTAGSRQEVTITATNTSNRGSIKRTFYITVTTDPTGVDQLTAVPVGREEYFTLSGMRVATPRGLTVVRQRMADGSTVTTKRFYR